MNYIVKDNFLKQEDFENIKNVMLGSDFPWYYNQYKVSLTEDPKPYVFQFTHTFYTDNNFVSPYSYILEPLIKEINPASITRIKANLTTKTPERIVYGNHVDYKDAKILKTAVYYLNTNDGATIFESGEEFKSIENRFVSFDCDNRHSGTSATDTNVRCLININYYESF